VNNIQTIILCGGLGTRLQEETEYRPKPMVPIGGKPILWHIMKIYSHYGFTNFVLPLGYKGEQIKEFFYHYHLMTNPCRISLRDHHNITFFSDEPDDVIDWNILCVDTGESTLKSGRLRCVEKYLTEDTIMITYGDGVADINIEDLVRFHKSQGKIATITAVSPAAQFGELKIDGNLITRIKEKEHISPHYVSGGFMVVNKDPFFKILDETTELEYGTFRHLADIKQLASYKHTGRWACMDTIRDREYLNSLWDNKDAFWKVW